ncbi:Pycsar system effector family protein [Streptomyces sp. NPDC060022]|uniref:Pycsar system effector family protein n=1 Tax=Streptomyces sp. NPDC060022 TaxID=3347039 RepID=UPI003677B5EF
MQPGRRQWVRECASYAFTEVQRADVKATVLCGVAGALLGVGVVCLTGTGGVPWVLACSLTVVCVLLGLSVGVSLWAIRPVIPAGGFQRELAGCGGVRGLGEFVAAVRRGGAVEEQWWEVRRLWVLSELAGRKLMWVRLGVDLVIAALIVAGLGVLITYVLG